MAQTPDISVARAVFISALLRSESGAPEVSREDATLFAKTLLRTCNICTVSNIKLCRSFITKNILGSNARTAALAKYLTTLSKSFCPRDLEKRIDTTKPSDDNEGLGKIMNGKVQQPPEPAFKRLHILYVLHDVLSYVQSHQHLFDRIENTREQLRVTICTLAELAACTEGGRSAHTSSAVRDVLAFWKKTGLLSSDQLDQIQNRVSFAGNSSWDALLRKLAADEDSKIDEQRRQKEDETKWIVPDRHGVQDDPTAPWHELPAANGLYMMRTRGYPLRANALPQGGFKLRHGGEEADPDLKRDVNNLYAEVLRCYDKYTDADEVQDIDALGNVIWKDPERPTRNYWGFTLEGIERRKDLAQDFADSATGYGDHGPGVRVNDAVERARALAAERGRGMGMAGGMGRGRGMGRGGWRGGRWR